MPVSSSSYLSKPITGTPAICHTGWRGHSCRCRQMTSGTAARCLMTALVLLVSAGWSQTVSAADYYVASTGVDANSGTTLAGAWKTLAKAAGSANAGDTVHVQAGTYAGNVTLAKSGTAAARIAFVGSGSPIIRGNLAFNGSYLSVEGFTVSPPSAGGYGAVTIDGQYNTFKNSTVTNYGASAGDQATAIIMDTNSSFVVVEGCTIRDLNDIDVFHVFGHEQTIRGCVVRNVNSVNYNLNHTDFIQTWGWPGSFAYNIIIEGNLVTNCNCQLGNLEIAGGYPSGVSTGVHDFTFRNNVFANIGAALFAGVPKTKFYNNVFYKCGDAQGYAVSYYNISGGYSSVGTEFKNNVFVGNQDDIDDHNGFNNVVIANNYFASATYAAKASVGKMGTGFVNGGDPKFINATGLDFHVQAGSVLIGKAADLSTLFATDKDGNSRSGTWDIGPYEYASGVTDTTAPMSPGGLAATVTSATRINLTWTASTDNVGGSGVADYRIYRGGTLIGTSATTSYSASGLSAATTYSFTVAARDAAGNASALSTAISATTQANHAPVAQAQSAGVSLNTAKALTLVATDVDGDALTYAIVAIPAHGTLSAGTLAARTYTPAAGYSGADSFTFRATDSHGAVSSTVAVTMTITAGVTTIGNTGEGSMADTIGDTTPWINSSRFTAANAMTVSRIKAKVGAISGSYQCAVYADNAGSPGAFLRATAKVTNPADGWQTFTLTSPLALTSGAGYWLAIWSSAANATVYAEASGGTLRWGQYAYSTAWPNPIATTGGGSYLYSIYAEAGAVANQAPVAAAQSVTIVEDTAKAITLAATDADGDAMTYAIVANPAHGTMSGSGSARTYTPVANYHGADSFTYKVNDGTVDSNPATVSITVTTVANATPVISAASALTSPVTGTTTVLAATATDDAGESALTYAWTATGPAAVAFSAANTNAAKAATATFIKAGTYILMVTAKDAGNLTATRTVTVTVNATVTRTTLSPTGASVQPLKTVDFSAVLEDQFGAALATQLTLAWTVSGGGTIDANGLFTAGAGTPNPSGGITATSYVVTATGGGKSGTALVTVSTASTATAAAGGCGGGSAVGLLLGLCVMLGLRPGRRR